MSTPELLNTTSDRLWLLSTALKTENLRNPADLPAYRDIGSCLMYGNADCPDRVDLFAASEPLIDDTPIAIFRLQDDGKYRRDGSTNTAMDLNLDAMSTADLWAFWKRLGMSGGVPYTVARELFPTRPKGYVTIAAQLKHYAVNKATAQTCRLDGRIDAAIEYETICDRIYLDLPDWAKGW